MMFWPGLMCFLCRAVLAGSALARPVETIIRISSERGTRINSEDCSQFVLLMRVTEIRKTVEVWVGAGEVIC